MPQNERAADKSDTVPPHGCKRRHLVVRNNHDDVTASRQGSGMGVFFSVLINNYNYGRFLGRAIESVLSQQDADFELIVVDDGSTDESRDVIARYRHNIEPILKENGGQASSFNAGFAASKGEVICLLDSDDYFKPEKLARLRAEYASAANPGWCFHEMEIESASGTRTRPRSRYRGLVDDRRGFRLGRPAWKFPATSALTFRREILGELLPMPEAKGVAVGDHYLKFGAATLSPGCLMPDILAVQTVHNSNAYTGVSHGRLEAEIQLRTALALKERLPEVTPFCDNLAGTASAIRRMLNDAPASLLELENKYWHQSSALGRLRMLAWRTAKAVRRRGPT